MPPPSLPPKADKKALKKRLGKSLVEPNAQHCADCDAELAWSASDRLLDAHEGSRRRKALWALGASLTGLGLVGGSGSGGALEDLSFSPHEPSEPHLLTRFGVLVCSACAMVHSSPQMADIHRKKNVPLTVLKAVLQKQQQEQQGSSSSSASSVSIPSDIKKHLPPAILSLRREYMFSSLRQLSFAQNAGNESQNEVLEFAVSAAWARKIPEILSSITERKEWILAKYSCQFAAEGTVEVLSDDEAEADECARLLLDADFSDDEATASSFFKSPDIAQAIERDSAVFQAIEGFDQALVELGLSDSEGDSDGSITESPIYHNVSEFQTESPLYQNIEEFRTDNNPAGDASPTAEAKDVSALKQNDSTNTADSLEDIMQGLAAARLSAGAMLADERESDDDLVLSMIGNYVSTKPTPKPGTPSTASPTGSASASPAPPRKTTLSRVKPSTPSKTRSGSKPGSAPSDKAARRARKRSVTTAKAMREAFKDEGRRVRSFVSARAPDNTPLRWPHPTIDVKGLAEAGLFFSPTAKRPDRVVCYDCGLSFSHWEANDDPLLAHQQHAEATQTQCVFLQQIAVVEMRAVLENLMRIPTNTRCCECGTEAIAFGSADHGVFLCRPCSQAHLDFGVSSEMLELPAWAKTSGAVTSGSAAPKTGPEDSRPWPRASLRTFVYLGNTTHREIWEYRLSAAAQARAVSLSRPEVAAELQRLAGLRPKVDSASEQRVNWLSIKYERRSFALPHDDKSQSVFFTGILTDHGPDVLEYLVECFSVDPAPVEGKSSASAPARARRGTARRVLRKTGWLTKHGTGVKSWRKNDRRRWWILRDNFVFVCADDQTSHVLQAYSLIGARVEDVPDEIGTTGAAGSDMTRDNFIIATPQKSIKLHAEGPREKEDWVSVLTQNIRWLETHHGAGPSSSPAVGNDAPAGDDYATSGSGDDKVVRRGFVSISKDASGKRKRRWCVLTSDTLDCFSSAKDVSPILSIGVRGAVVEMDDKVKEHNRGFVVHTHEGTFTMSCDTSGKSREWVDAIRLCAETSDAGVAGPRRAGIGRRASHATLKAASDQEDVIKAEFLHKKGDPGQLGVLWKKRWFILKDGQLSYFKKASDTVPAGSISLAAAKARIPEAHEEGQKKGKHLIFHVVTPTRTFVIGAATEPQREAWVSAVNAHVEQLLSSM